MDEHNSLSMISFIERLEKKANRLLKDAQLQDWIEEVFQENLQYAHYPRTRISLCGRFNAEMYYFHAIEVEEKEHYSTTFSARYLQSLAQCCNFGRRNTLMII